jgi:putative colanic acid biosynthesis UDP-glucose lipid carrier transferase
MENSTAPLALENSVLKKVDHLEVLDIVYTGSAVTNGHRPIPLEKSINLFFKRLFDLVVSSLFLVFLFSWLFPIIALLIKLDSKGPVFFLQKRNKKGGRLFTCIKFRTMVVNKDADHMPAFENDHRITRIGRFLRMNHIDELPQLLNVWWGDMSLIGPRPYMISDNMKFESVIEDYSIRHKVKPGITGPAQLLGYGGNVSDQKMQHRVDMDFYYVKNWTLKLDVVILCKTVRKTIGL